LWFEEHNDVFVWFARVPRGEGGGRRGTHAQLLPRLLHEVICLGGVVRHRGWDGVRRRERLKYNSFKFGNSSAASGLFFLQKSLFLFLKFETEDLKINYYHKRLNLVPPCREPKLVWKSSSVTRSINPTHVNTDRLDWFYFLYNICWKYIM